jgi:signal transduction histidine kinase
MKAALTPEPQDPRGDDSRPDMPSRVGARSDAETLKEIARQIRAGELTTPFRRGSEARDFAAALTSGENAASDEIAGSPPDQAESSEPDADHLAKLAHELKTPISAIAAAAEVMRDERLGKMQNDRYLGYAADIHESATHALDVIASLLSRNKKPNTSQPPLATLDLNAIVDRTVSSTKALAASRGVLLAFEAESSRPHVTANPTAMRQILLNLLANALKFTPPGGDVRVVTGYLNDGRVFLVVRDTGCGMNGDVATVNENSSQASEGNGIGLPLVQRLVREMGAEIEFDSAPGKGTVVLIAFGGRARSSA